MFLSGTQKGKVWNVRPGTTSISVPDAAQTNYRSPTMQVDMTEYTMTVVALGDSNASRRYYRFWVPVGQRATAWEATALLIDAVPGEAQKCRVSASS